MSNMSECSRRPLRATNKTAQETAVFAFPLVLSQVPQRLNFFVKRCSKSDGSGPLQANWFGYGRRETK